MIGEDTPRAFGSTTTFRWPVVVGLGNSRSLIKRNQKVPRAPINIFCMSRAVYRIRGLINHNIEMEELDDWWGSANGSSHNSSCPGNVKLHAEWVEKAFGQCVDTPLRYVSVFVGLSSIACWLVAQAPQMITNCRLGIADKALSFWFLLQWFLGDVTNLIGALLTHQLASQVITAVYFCLIDILMMGQFLYYVIKNQGAGGLLKMFKCPKATGEVAAIFLPGVMCTMLLASWPHMTSLVGGGAYSSDVGRTGRVLLNYQPTVATHHDGPAVDPHKTVEFIGYLIGCVSAVFYLGSRMPQIIQNFARCSVTGVSLPMFILAVMGNVTYSLGIFLYSVDGYFLLQKLPWIVGSIGTLCFDFTIFTQFIIFQGFGVKCKKLKDEDASEDERKPLLASAEDGNGLPCFNQKGSVQGPLQRGGKHTYLEGSEGEEDEVKSRYGTAGNAPHS